MSRNFQFATALAVSSLALMSAAYADNITVGLQAAGVNSGNITIVDNGSASVSWNNIDYGMFNTGGTGSNTVHSGLPEIANSTSDNVALISATSAATLTIWVTSQGLSTPMGANLSWFTGFTSNTLPAGWTVVETDFVDTANGLYNNGVTTDTCGTPPCATAASSISGAASVTLLQTTTFTSSGAVTNLFNSQSISAPFSITEEYVITGFWNGSDSQAHETLDTISLSASTTVPEPASLAIFGAGLLGLAMFGRRRKSN